MTGPHRGGRRSRTRRLPDSGRGGDRGLRSKAVLTPAPRPGVPWSSP